MDKWREFFKNQSFTLLLAPAGGGKTTFILDLFAGGPFSILFISPLRALSEEFYERAKDLKSVYFINRKSDKRDLHEKIKSKKAMVITTPEMISDENVRMWGKEKNYLVVMDEFHLFYYWGMSFRPYMWELLMGISTLGLPLLGLTATMEEVLIKEWQRDFALNFNELKLLNYGNQKLKNPPVEVFNYSRLNSKSLHRRFFYELKNMGEVDRLLFFCRFRHEVHRWVELCEKLGVCAIGCVGGEVSEFMKNFNTRKHRVVFATSALSHGINLPNISKIFINYPVNNTDFYVQMIGRGGRTGEKFQIYCLEELKSGEDSLITYLKLWILDIVLKLYFFIRPINRINFN